MTFSRELYLTHAEFFLAEPSRRELRLRAFVDAACKDDAPSTRNHISEANEKNNYSIEHAVQVAQLPLQQLHPDIPTERLRILCGGQAVTIYGTSGDDTLEGTPGDDVIHGFGGKDKIDGLGGNDIICSGHGNDRMTGNDGNDIVDGGSGDDVLGGENGNDALYGGDGDDILLGGPNLDRLSGGLGNDRLYGQGGNDWLFGYIGPIPDIILIPPL